MTNVDEPIYRTIRECRDPSGKVGRIISSRGYIYGIFSTDTYFVSPKKRITRVNPTKSFERLLSRGFSETRNPNPNPEAASIRPRFRRIRVDLD